MRLATAVLPADLDALAREERKAWMLYLATTRELPDLRYEEFEPAAWARLGKKLAEIHARRDALEAVAA